MKNESRSKVGETITEEDVLSALKYESPQSIIVLNMAARVPDGLLRRMKEHGRIDRVCGNIYLTKAGKQDAELAMEDKSLSWESFYETFNKVGINLLDLEEAVERYPDVFDPKGESSIFKFYKYYEIVDAYIDRVMAILRYDMSTPIPPMGKIYYL